MNAFKWSLDGRHPVLLFWESRDGRHPVLLFWESRGKPAPLALPEGVKLLPCNTLEAPTGKAAVSAYTFRPFEIATFRVML